MEKTVCVLRMMRTGIVLNKKEKAVEVNGTLVNEEAEFLNRSQVATHPVYAISIKPYESRVLKN